jgi:hypothetical protein
LRAAGRHAHLVGERTVCCHSPLGYIQSSEHQTGLSVDDMRLPNPWANWEQASSPAAPTTSYLDELNAADLRPIEFSKSHNVYVSLNMRLSFMQSI